MSLASTPPELKLAFRDVAIPLCTGDSVTLSPGVSVGSGGEASVSGQAQWGREWESCCAKVKVGVDKSRSGCRIESRVEVRGARRRNGTAGGAGSHEGVERAPEREKSGSGAEGFVEGEMGEKRYGKEGRGSKLVLVAGRGEDGRVRVRTEVERTMFWGGNGEVKAWWPLGSERARLQWRIGLGGGKETTPGREENNESGGRIESGGGAAQTREEGRQVVGGLRALASRVQRYSRAEGEVGEGTTWVGLRLGEEDRGAQVRWTIGEGGAARLKVEWGQGPEGEGATEGRWGSVEASVCRSGVSGKVWGYMAVG